MLIMDSNSSDHSPPLSENAGTSWLNWENEISSISGLNLDSASELSGLVEDKEIASRAVAFVVNSTRKGIVPLCADIASLLRAKRSLEKKVFLLKRENESLRGSSGVNFRTSHSTSPTPPSFTSCIDKSFLLHHGAGAQEHSRPCSQCSLCSSTFSSSPKLEKTYSFKGHLHSPPTHTDKGRSPCIARRPPNGITAPSTAHHLLDAGVQGSGCEVDNTGNRKNSLPEIISEPDSKAFRVSPKISKEVQCTLLRHSDSPLDEQFIETVKLNTKLAEELGAARKEIEILKGRMKELEMNHLARECWREHYLLKSETEDSHCLYLSDDQSAETSEGLVEKQHNSINGTSRHRLPCQFTKQPGSVVYAEPLYGCKCTACEEAIGGEVHTALAQTLNQDLHKFPVNSKLHIRLGDHVVIKGERTGRVRYIGHIDKIGQPNMVFVGLELDAPVGRHDGFLNGKRYFFCQKDHGFFLPLHDVVCKVHPKKLQSVHECFKQQKSLHQHTRWAPKQEEAEIVVTADNLIDEVV